MSNDYQKELEQIRYAETLSDPKGTMKAASSSFGTADSSRIERMLEAPESNYIQIAGLMNALRRKNGSVGSTLRYFTSHLTYNYSLYSAPVEKNNFNIGQETLTDYLGAATFIDMYGVKRMSAYFAQQVLINGMAFFYEIKDSKGVSYMEFPISWGRISSMKNGVYRWEIDMSQVKDNLVPYMPNEIQKAYEQKKNRASMDEKRWREGKYYRLSDKAVAFCIDQQVMSNGGIAISELAALLVDSVRLEKAKNNIQIKDDIDTVRVVHAKIPLDKESKPTIPATAAREYGRALQNALPKGVVGITNPMELTNVPLSGAGSTKSYEIADKAQKQLFLSTGAPANLFGGETTSSNIVKMSIKKDAAWLYTTILPMLEAYYNSVLNGFNTKGKSVYRISFLRQSNFTIDEDIKNIKEAVAMGGSRLDYLAALGNEPLEAYSKLVMEQSVLNIDSIMLPKQTSYTMSSTDGEGAGRPVEDNPTDDTDRINDSE